MRALMFVLVGVLLGACQLVGSTDEALRCDPSKMGRSPTYDRRCATDAGPQAPPQADAGTVSPPPTATDAGPLPSTECVSARRLWADDFETGDYRNWTGSYGGRSADGCRNNWLTTSGVHSGTYAQRSVITCTSPDSHRGYAGMQFSGDTPLPDYTNSGVGTYAPNGLVNTFWVRLDLPSYLPGDGRWISLWTANSDCNWAERVVTLGLENPGMRLTPAHIWDTGGTVTFSPNAPSFPTGRWVRVTVYINYVRGQMHVWQDGASVVHATFSRPTQDVCHWHWGLYASGNNYDVAMMEDEKSIWKLEESWTDFNVEPWFEGPIRACGY
jgi:hypothetical protein